jgi:anthraniloyl-CoA monooxygenase
MDPQQFAFGVISRSKQITYENVRLRDPKFFEGVSRWFADSFTPPGFEVAVRNPPPPMFTPLMLRGMRLENRVVVSPMDQYKAVDGMPNDWHLVHLGARAVGGAGLVFVEMTCPSPEARISPGCTGLWNEAQRDAFKRIVDFCHAQSAAKLAMQLGHSGRKGSTQLGWERPDYPLASGNWELLAPSPLPYGPQSQTPREMSRTDMDRIRDDFVRSAAYAHQAGFDMLELHMAHGYLLSSFISPLTNLRKDRYGGPIANRLRYPLEVFRAVRAVWPEDKPMSIRISATDWAPGGLSENDLLALARAFKDAGVDLIDVSTGQVVPQQKPIYGRMYQTPYADKIRNELGLVTMAVGNITSADQVNTIVISGRADLVALARAHLADPYFTLHAAAWYQHTGQFWPRPYWSGRDQAYRLAVADRAEWTAGRIATRPPSHEAKDEPALSDEKSGGSGKKAA